MLADANFPAESVAACTPEVTAIRADGIPIPVLLDAILRVLPLDETAPPCVLMGMMPEHVEAGWKTPIWETYKEIANRHEGREVPFEEVERFAFYERAKKAYCVIATGESALYGNLILKKGVLAPE